MTIDKPPPGASQRTWTQSMDRASGPGDQATPEPAGSPVQLPPECAARARPDEVAGPHTGTILAGRYRLCGRIGEGGGGDVYRSWDPLEEQEVAVKIFRPRGEGGRDRIRREVAALRLLQLPGVVPILDDGEDAGTPFLVMEIIEGTPFPGEGHQGGWDALQVPAIDLLHTLARIHDNGVVHRDIKPSNVLVDAEGKTTVLDFGLVRGEAVGDSVTTAGHVVGTPRYLAPEQLAGDSIGPAADLYAVGAMLYEALAGRTPHCCESLQDLWRAKLMETPAPLRQLVDELPRQVSDTIDRLLLRRAGERPQTAGAVVAALGGAPTTSALPWLGSRQAIDAAVHAGRTGARLRVVGAPGSGRTRVLHEAAAQLEKRQVPVRWARPGARPFESLAHLISSPVDQGMEGPDGARKVMAVRLEQLLDSGTVLFVDNREQLDEWSAALVEQAHGAVISTCPNVTTTASGTLFHLQPLSVQDLKPLFAGPERILHIPQDAAVQLHRRTGGRPDQVEAEVRAWVRAGLATWDGARLVMTRVAVDRLRSAARVGSSRSASPPVTLSPSLRRLLAWAQLAGTHATVSRLARLVDKAAWEVALELEALERHGAVVRGEHGAIGVTVQADLSAGWLPSDRCRAHGILADDLAPGAEARLFHLLSAGRLDEVAEEAVAQALRLRRAGHVGEALAVLTEALRAIRRESAAGEALLLPHLLRCALASDTLRDLERVRYEVTRSSAPHPGLLDLVDAGIDGRRHYRTDALDRQPPFEDPLLELCRQYLRFQAAHLDPTARQRVIEELRATPRIQQIEIDLGARLVGWEGIVAYANGDSKRAATLHEQSADTRHDALGRLSARINAAMAWVEACEYDRALAAGRQARSGAAEARHCAYEARASWVCRTVAARRGEAVLPDLELVEAVAAIGQPELAGTVAHTEAILAWRGGDLGTCLDLASRAITAFEEAQLPPAILHTRALRALARGRIDDAERDELLAGVEVTTMAVVALDVLGVLATVHALPGDWSRRAEQLADGLPEMTLRHTRGIMSPEAAIARVREAAARGT